MLQRHWKKVVIGVVALVALGLVGTWAFVTFIEKADPAFGQEDVTDRLNATTTIAVSTSDPGATDPATVGSTDPGTVDTTTSPASTGTGVDGVWNIAAESEVGYRVDETLNGFDTTANGRTKSITGSFTIDGTQVTAGEWTVDMTTFKSDQSRRDAQFNGRIMTVDQFPTSTFTLTAPIEFGSVPADGATIAASATGDLTLRGVTNSVTFDVQATFQNGRIGVLGQIPIVFADYGIENPSFATVTTEDHGLLEFVLIFDKA